MVGQRCLLIALAYFDCRLLADSPYKADLIIAKLYADGPSQFGFQKRSISITARVASPQTEIKPDTASFVPPKYRTTTTATLYNPADTRARIMGAPAVLEGLPSSEKPSNRSSGSIL